MTKNVANASSGEPLNFRLESADIIIENVEITAEKAKYDKSNPAVELIKSVVQNRDVNKPGKSGYLKYQQYTSKSLALNEVTHESMQKGVWKQMNFLKEYVDTTGGNQVVSFFLNEQVEELEYSNGARLRKRMINEHKTELDMRFFDQNVKQILDHLIQKVDVYDNTLFLLDNNFQNPISRAGLGFYRYYIIDTLQNDRGNVVHLWTTPANKKDIGFTGDVYIQDVDKAIVKVEYALDKRAKLNWAEDVKFKQEYEYTEGQWVDKHSSFQALFNFFNFGNGVLGKSRVVNTEYQFSKSMDEKYGPTLEQMSPSLENIDNADPEFWIKYRAQTDGEEEAVLNMIDSLNTNKKFGLLKKVGQVLISGHWNTGKVEIGPFGSAYTYNPVEGSRVKMGFRTTNKLHPTLHLQGHAAYGFLDKKIKYRLVALKSFNEDFDKNPVHYLAFEFGKEQFGLGQLRNSSYRGNLLTSFVRGTNTQFIATRFHQLIYDREYNSDFRLRLFASQRRHRGVGSLDFMSLDPQEQILKVRDINISTIGTRLRWAPNQHYIQSNTKRIPIHSKYPIFELGIERGIPNLLNSDVDYTKVEFLIFKRIFLSKFGHSDFLVEGGKSFGEGIPYHLLFIPAGNQTFFYQHRKYNMLNFFEFVTDKYFSINYRHFFKGFIMNRIPLINKLGLRSMVTMKAIWGDLDNENNPELDNELIQFPTSVDSDAFLLGQDPYLEGSVAVTNIFKVLRIDLVKRFNYLDSDDIPSLFGKKGLGVRVKLEASF